MEANLIGEPQRSMKPKRFQNLTLRCIKGTPIDSIHTRTLQEIGFPVEAPMQPDFQHSPSYERYFSKLYSSPYSELHAVEKRYILDLLQCRSREKAFQHILSELSRYDVRADELIAGLTCGCVYQFSVEDAQTMLDEFIFIIEELLPRQLSDLYYSFDIEPNPAHGVFFDIASEQLKLQKYEDRNRNNFGQFVTHVSDGVRKRILSDETFQSIYLTTCSTKSIINEVFSDMPYSEFGESGQDRRLREIENGVFRLSRQYRYERIECHADQGICSGFRVIEHDQPVLDILYLSAELYRNAPNYEKWLSQVQGGTDQDNSL